LIPYETTTEILKAGITNKKNKVEIKESPKELKFVSLEHIITANKERINF
jgi:hypothetical protein